MERKRILKRLYGEPPKFDPAEVEILLRDVEMRVKRPSVEVAFLEEQKIDISDYAQIEYIYEIGGQTYFKAERVLTDPEKRREEAIIGPDGEPIGGWFDSTEDAKEVNGKPYFCATKIEDEQKQEAVIGPDGRVVGKWRNGVGHIQEIGGELHFWAFEMKNEICGPHGYVRFAFGGSFWKLYNIGEKPYVKIMDDDGYALLDSRGKKIGKSVIAINDPVAIGGKPYFWVNTPKGVAIRAYDGDTIGGYFSNVRGLTAIDKEPYFIADFGSENMIIGPDGRPVIIHRHNIASFAPFDGQIQFIKKNKGRYTLFDANGTVLSKDYAWIEPAKIFGDEVYYAVHKNLQDKAAVMDGHGNVLTEWYAHIKGIHVIDEELIIRAQENGQGMKLCDIDGPFSDAYRFIKEPVSINGVLFAVAEGKEGELVLGPDGKPIIEDFWERIYQLTDLGDGYGQISGIKDGHVVTQPFRVLGTYGT